MTEISQISFTFILPLFPRLLDFYLSFESSTQLSPPTLLTTIVIHLNSYKRTIGLPVDSRYDVVLLGGALGSLFSLLQAISAPILGRYSDTAGRRSALLLSMCGNIVSLVLWLAAGSSFKIFLLSRIVGGLSEGNVQLAIAMATDISNEKQRGATMAIIGGCFSVAFTFGPLLGAWLSSQQLVRDNPFGVAAGFSLLLIIVETVYLYFCLPETLPSLVLSSTKTPPVEPDSVNAQPQKFQHGKTPSLALFPDVPIGPPIATLNSNKSDDKLAQMKAQLMAQLNAEVNAELKAVTNSQVKTEKNPGPKTQMRAQVKEQLRAEMRQELHDARRTNSHFSLNATHFAFILLFSGIEFSLPFMTSTLFSYTPLDNGRLLGFIGLVASILQGAVTRRLPPLTNIHIGVISCLIAMTLLSSPAHYVSEGCLYLAAAFLAVTSATVVTSLNALSSFEAGAGERGKTLGGLRSAGQVGRAVGPVAFCTLYWWVGRETSYKIGAMGMLPVVAWVLLGLGDPAKRKKTSFEKWAEKKEL